MHFTGRRTKQAHRHGRNFSNCFSRTRASSPDCICVAQVLEAPVFGKEFSALRRRGINGITVLLFREQALPHEMFHHRLQPAVRYVRFPDDRGYALRLFTAYQHRGNELRLIPVAAHVASLPPLRLQVLSADPLRACIPQSRRGSGASSGLLPIFGMAGASSGLFNGGWRRSGL